MSLALTLFTACPPSDDDDSSSGDDDDDATADDDDATADDDDATADDDDDSAAAVVDSVVLSADDLEADTRGSIALTVTVNWSDGSSEVTEDYSISFANEAGATPVLDGSSVSSATAGSAEASATVDSVSSEAVELVFVGAPAVAGDFVINELLADGTAGDANGDASTDADEDTFVEFVSTADVDLSLQGAQVYESELTSLARHTFGDVLVPAGSAVVVFGGGSPASAPAGSQWFAADNANDPGTPFYLHLDPEGDIIELRDAAGSTLVSMGYGNEAGGAPNANIDEAITLDPQLTGSSYSPHSQVAGDAAVLYSPGTLADGSSF